MTTQTDWSRLTGYTDRLSARPGECLRAMVSAARPPRATVVSLPRREPAAAHVRELEPAASRSVVTGACVVVDHDPALRPDDGLEIAAWIWIAPRSPAGCREALLATWGPGGDGWALILDECRRPTIEVGAGGRRSSLSGEVPLTCGRWTRLEAAVDPRRAIARITAHARGQRNPLDQIEGRIDPPAPGPAPGPLMLGAEPGPDGVAQSHLDGKLDRPELRGRGRVIAAWDLGQGRGRRVVDRGPHGLDGRCVNGPLRAVTGHNWSGDTHDWRHATEQYGAMHFHADAVDDLGWPASYEIELAESLPSGVYGLVLEADGVEDVLAFAVRRAAAATAADTAVLLPTFTYLAYSCERGAPREAGSARPEDGWVAEQGLRSLYDRHRDGTGVYEASLLRPLTQLRPGYRCPQHGGPHGLAQDLILLDWLHRRGIDHEVVTDHDLEREGPRALAGVRTVITGAHPEYASARLLDALDAHLQGGRNLAYLGGNGLNGSVSVDAERPHVLELRRTETQGLAWQAAPGEHHHASGDYGGDWRRRGRPEHATLGVGLRAFGSAAASAYRRPEGAEDPAAASVFAGIERDVPLTADGAVLGGAAGYEVDAFDPRAGSPADAAVLASARMADGYEIWPDDVIDGPGDGGEARADMVLVRRPEGGAVFSVGSIAWTGCLEDDGGTVSRVTANVLAELGRERPFTTEADRG